MDMKTRQLSGSCALARVLVLLVSAVGCDASVDALGSSTQEISTIYPNPDECPEAPTEAMTADDKFGDLSELAACPGTPPGTVCAYDVRDTNGAYDGWAAYVCGCTVENHWKDIGTTITGYECPDLAPAPGAPCEALPGPCPYYPNLQASCIDGAWLYYEPGPRYPCDALGVILP
jgi:hypothetical protein